MKRSKSRIASTAAPTETPTTILSSLELSPAVFNGRDVGENGAGVDGEDGMGGDEGGNGGVGGGGVIGVGGKRGSGCEDVEGSQGGCE